MVNVSTLKENCANRTDRYYATRLVTFFVPFSHSVWVIHFNLLFFAMNRFKRIRVGCIRIFEVGVPVTDYVPDIVGISSFSSICSAL